MRLVIQPLSIIDETVRLHDLALPLNHAHREVTIVRRPVIPHLHALPIGDGVLDLPLVQLLVHVRHGVEALVQAPNAEWAAISPLAHVDVRSLNDLVSNMFVYVHNQYGIG